MPFGCNMRFEKGEKSCRKGGFEPWSIASKWIRHTVYLLRHQSWQPPTDFCNLDQTNHTLVGGVSVNSLCHQGRLFALNVNRHSVKTWPMMRKKNDILVILRKMFGGYLIKLNNDNISDPLWSKSKCIIFIVLKSRYAWIYFLKKLYARTFSLSQ